VDDAIPMNVMPVTVEDLRKQHVCSSLPYLLVFSVSVQIVQEENDAKSLVYM
jgi:hypothetical protein